MTQPGFASSDDIFRLLTSSPFLRKGGGRGAAPRRRSDGEGSSSADKAWEDDRPSDTSLEEAAEDQAASKPDDTQVTLTAAWIEEKVFFNSKAKAEVKANLPAAAAHLTRVELTLFAVNAEGRRERLDKQEAFIKGGRAACEFTAFIPAGKPGEEPPKECEYVFTAKHSLSKEAESPELKGESRPMGWLRLKLERAFQGPLANRKCTLKIAGESHEVTTDANGVLAKFVPAEATRAEILVQADEKNPKALTLQVAIDKLEAADKPKGARDRLDSMGYVPGPDAGKPTFRKALEEFQCDAKLTLSGDLDAATQGKLKEAFGC